MEVIRKFVVLLGLKGDCPVGLLDDKHVLLRPSLEEDFTRLWVRRTWYIQKFTMNVSKWSIDFRPSQDSSIAPVWINLPELPLNFFNKSYLHKIAGLLGCPLQLDDATLDLRRPSVQEFSSKLMLQGSRQSGYGSGI